MRALLALVLASACGNSPTAAHGDATTSDTSTSGDAAACGARSGMRGATHRTLAVAGLQRTYVVYLPSSLDPHARIPLVFVHHGYTMSGQDMFDLTGYPALADREHVALAFPDGQGGPGTFNAPWNVGDNVCPSTSGAPPDAPGDDFAFLDAMKADIAQDQCLDLDHVYVTGFSMGGYFAHQAGCMKPDVRAVAPHSGGTHALDTCITGHKPIIIFHGIADTLIPDGCDDPAGTPVSGVTPSAAAWAAHNGCGTTVTTVTVQGGSCARYDGCPADGQVEICTFAGMGHCWAGGMGSSVYACGTYASATELAWQFFKTYAW